MHCHLMQAWWLGSEDHLAAFLSAEAVLRKHYSRCACTRRVLPSLLEMHRCPPMFNGASHMSTVKLGRLRQ